MTSTRDEATAKSSNCMSVMGREEKKAVTAEEIEEGNFVAERDSAADKPEGDCREQGCKYSEDYFYSCFFTSFIRLKTQ